MKKLIEHGFELLGEVAITDVDCEYHVPVEYAIHERQFWKLRGKALLFVVDHIRYKWRSTGEETDYYYVKFHGEMLSDREMHRRLFNREKDEKSWGEDSYDTAPGFNAPIVMPNDLNHSTNWFETKDPERIVPEILKITKQVEANLTRYFTERLYNHGLAPEYSFKDCWEIFRQRFENWGYFHAVMYGRKR